MARLYQLTSDEGVRNTLSFLLARDTMHQNQWLAAIEELVADGLEDTPAPKSFPQSREIQSVAYQYWNCSEGEESSAGRWASGPAPDGKGEFEYLANPVPLGEVIEELKPIDPRVHSTPKVPTPPVAD